jgi:ribosomal protein S18 acetylase RimI-like enzyme
MQIRWAALLDAPTAFAVSYQAALLESDERWQARTQPTSATAFCLALEAGVAVGLVGAGLDATGRYQLIALWLAPLLRGSGVAAQLVAAVKARALHQGHRQVHLQVAADNARALSFYRQQGFVLINESDPLHSAASSQLHSLCWTSEA